MKGTIHSLIATIALLCVGCGSNNTGYSELEQRCDFLSSVILNLNEKVDSLENKNKHFIEIPFTDLLSMFKSDSIEFGKKTESLGFKRINEDTYVGNTIGASINNEGLGQYMFVETPALERIYSINWLIYNFPIEKLCKYKSAILDRTVKLESQERMYHDKYETIFMRENYIDRINNLEYELRYTDKYAWVRILNSHRSF